MAGQLFDNGNDAYKKIKRPAEKCEEFRTMRRAAKVILRVLKIRLFDRVDIYVEEEQYVFR